MEQLNLALAAAGGTVLCLGMFTRRINHSYVSIPLLALISGILLGPLGTGLLMPTTWGDSFKILEEGARLTLGISLMAIALRIPKNFLFKHRTSLIILLGIGMPAMFLISGLIAHWTLGLPFLVALLVGAAVCPTDPVVASSIVTGGLARQHLPEAFRYGLSTESAANDGLAYPLVFLPIFLLEPNHESPWVSWFWEAIIWPIGGAVMLGISLGWAVGKSLLWAERHNTLDHKAFLATTLALTILALGLGKYFATDSIVVVFVAGVVFSQLVDGSARAKEDNVQETVNLFFTIPIFILFGLMLPVERWLELGWGGAVFTIGVLLFRRIPVILLLAQVMPLWKNWKLALLAGHFGPIGISALFYSMVILEKSGHDIAWVAGSLVVTASLMVHGMSASPAARVWARIHEK